MSAKPIPVRLTDETIERLDAAADMLGLTSRSDVIKLAITAIVRHIEQGGTLTLPPEWKKILLSLDGRTKKGRKK